MKKTILSLAIAVLVGLFISCDDSLPQVTTEQGADAYFAATLTMYASPDTPGLNVIEDTADSFHATFSSVDLGPIYVDTGYSSADIITNYYDSISGSLTWDAATDNVIWNVTLTGGPVVTAYIEINQTTGDMVMIINGHDMTVDIATYLSNN